MTRKEFNTMVTVQSESLKGRALHFTKNHEDANDLVQDTLVKAITNYNKFKLGTNLKGWLYTIMKNTFINNYRLASRKNTFVVQSDQISCANLVYSSNKNAGERKFILEDIRKALSTLSDDYYIPFTMYFEGYKYREIAVELDLPLGTVKTRIHVARKSLQDELLTYSDKVELPIFA